MEQLSQVSEGITNLGSQLDQGAQLTGGIVSAVILQLITVVKMFSMAETERGSFAHQTGVEIRTLHEKLSQAKGGIDVLTNQKGSARRERPFLESKAFQG